MRNIKIIIEYDGTEYSGWQIQNNATSVQGELLKAIFTITGEKVILNGSGRTDAGVHAKGQVANFKTESNISGDKFAYALNSVLPKDIAVKESKEVYNDFHARYCAIGKKYSYTFLNSRHPSPILRKFAYHINYCDKLSIEILKEACAYFTGTHDFYGFMSTGSKVKDTVRTIGDITIEIEGEIIRISYVGNGFLYNMVRIITGTILYSAIGKINAYELPKIILSKNRTLAGITVPANGLCLEKVYY